MSLFLLLSFEAGLNSQLTLLPFIVVLPEGPEAIRDQELGGVYFEAAAPIVELQIAKAGYRLAAWLDLIVEAISKNETISPPTLPIQKPDADADAAAGILPIAEQKPMGLMLGGGDL